MLYGCCTAAHGDMTLARNRRTLAKPTPLQFWAEAYGSRTHPRPRGRPCNGFEDREAHRDPHTSIAHGALYEPAHLVLCHAPQRAPIGHAAALADPHRKLGLG